MDISDVHISDQDKKILDNMRRKREEKQHCEDLAHRVNIIWEQMREEEKRLTKEQKQKWRNFVMAKRNVENGMNQMRLEELRMAFENNQKQLEEHMRKKSEKVNELKRQIEDRKVYMLINCLEFIIEIINFNFFFLIIYNYSILKHIT